MQKIVKHFAMAVATLIGLGAAGTASANPTIIINDSNGGLVSYDTTTKVSTVLGNTGTVMFDIALNSGGDLFGVDGGTLFKISTSGPVWPARKSWTSVVAAAFSARPWPCAVPQ